MKTYGGYTSESLRELLLKVLLRPKGPAGEKGLPAPEDTDYAARVQEIATKLGVGTDNIKAVLEEIHSAPDMASAAATHLIPRKTEPLVVPRGSVLNVGQAVCLAS